MVSSYRKKIWISILLLSDVNGGISTGQAGHCAVHDALSVHASFIRRLYIDSSTVQVHFPEGAQHYRISFLPRKTVARDFT